MNDVKKIEPDVLTVPSHYLKNDISSNHLSDLVVLMMSSCLPKDSKEAPFFNYDVLTHLKKCKPNIMNGNLKNKHFGSSGSYFAFSNKGFYGMKDNVSSISQYAIKKSKNIKVQEVIKLTSEKMEQIASSQIKVAIKDLSRLIPNIRKLISPVLQQAVKKQEIEGNVNFKNVKSSEHGVFQSEICINAVTKIFHTEKDCTYTLISVPHQATSKEDNKLTRSPTYFMFKINDEINIVIPMNYNNTSIIFHGQMLTHRQHCTDAYRENYEELNYQPFFNLGCYGNEKLFNHLKKSFQRLNSNK